MGKVDWFNFSGHALPRSYKYTESVCTIQKLDNGQPIHKTYRAPNPRETGGDQRTRLIRDFKVKSLVSLQSL